MLERIREQNVIKYDMPIEIFRYWKNMLMNCIQQEWIDKENTQQIKKALQEKLPYDVKKDWIVVFGKDLGYNIQAKKKRLLILKFQSIAFFIYQPKYLDLGKPEVIEVFSKKLEQNKVDEILEYIQVLKNQNQIAEKIDENIREWLAKFIVTYKDKMNNNYADWERHMISKIKMELQYRGKQGYWHIYISSRMDYIIHDIDDCNMLFEIDFGGFSKMKSKKKLLIIHKKGFAEPIFGMWKTKIPEFMGFCGMLLMFVSVAFCKGGKLLSIEEPQDAKFTHLSENMVTNELYRDMPIKDQICRHYSIILYAGAALFFSYLGNKMLGKYKDRGEKMKAIRNLKKE